MNATKIKVKFTLNPGREGISWSKLSKQAENIQALLNSISTDLGLAADNWLANQFGNGSCISHAEYQALTNSAQHISFNELFTGLVELTKGDVASYSKEVNPRTALIFSSLNSPMDIDEKILIGLYDPLSPADEEPYLNLSVSKPELKGVESFVEQESQYFGSIIGHTYEWNKGAKEPFIKIRDIATKELVKCNYSNKDYQKVSKLFEQENSLAIVTGHLTYSWIDNKTEMKKATDFELAPEPLSLREYESFFGCSPGFTGGEDAAKYIRKRRV